MKQHWPLLPFAAIMATAMAMGGCSKPPEVAVNPPATGEHIGNVADIDITQHVMMTLNQNDSLKGLDITVSTLKGDVRLMGSVDSQMQIDEAVAIARASEGAHTIHNELTIKP